MVKVEREGVSKLNNQGLKMTCIKYRNVGDIDIEFEESGYVRKHSSWKSFCTGQVSDLSVEDPRHVALRESKEGTIRYNKQGLEMVCIKYVNGNNINVKFTKSGLIREKVRWVYFDNGTLSDTTVPKSEEFGKKEIGCVYKSSEGWDLKVIGYDSSKKVKVFCKVTGYEKFCTLQELKNRGVSGKIRIEEGVEFLSSEGIKLRIIEVPLFQSGKIKNFVTLLRLDTGEKLERVARKSFVSGGFLVNKDNSIKNPIFDRCGERYTVKLGLEVEVCRYTPGDMYCDVKILGVNTEEKIVLKDTYYDNLKKGVLSKKHDDYLEELIYKGVILKKYVFEESKIVKGDIHTSYNGQKYMVKKVHKRDLGKSKVRVDIEFEDGVQTTVLDETIKKESVRNPDFYLGIYRDEYSVKKGSSVGCVNVLKYGYFLGKKGHFYVCECSKCGMKDILNPREILLHKCNDGVVKIPQWVL